MKGMVKKIFRLSPLTLSLAITAILIAVYLFGPTYSEVMEYKARDLRFNIRGKIKPGPEVVLAVVDEKALDEVGPGLEPRSPTSSASWTKTGPRCWASISGF